jgi:anti-sigma B factor antagonist
MTEEGLFVMREVEVAGHRGLVEIEGHLDVGSAPELKSRLIEIVDQGVSLLVVDLTPTAFLDSSGVAVLASVQQRLERGGGALGVVMGDAHLAERFVRAGVDRLFVVAGSTDAAFERLEAE